MNVQTAMAVIEVGVSAAAAVKAVASREPLVVALVPAFTTMMRS